MTSLQYLVIAAAGCTVFLAILLIMVPTLHKPRAIEQRLLNVVQSHREETRRGHLRERGKEYVYKVAGDTRQRLGVSVGRRSIDRLHAAGYRSAGAPDIFFALQWSLPVVGLFVGSFVPLDTLFWSFVGAVVGYLLPNLWVSKAIVQRREKIRRSLPDVIDLLVVCVDAGLGLDQAMLRVTDELHGTHDEMQQELSRVLLEQRAGHPRLEAWQDLAERTQTKELAAFVGMLTQTDRFGTPIVKALRQFAEDLRLKRRQKAEEAAAKMKIKIVFPLVFFIFPCLFIVLLAPALMKMADMFSNMAK